jgi:tetratricopeptide (TPR) repeat protein
MKTFSRLILTVAFLAGPNGAAAETPVHVVAHMLTIPAPVGAPVPTTPVLATAAKSANAQMTIIAARKRVQQLSTLVRQSPSNLPVRRALVEALLQSGLANEAANQMQSLVKIGMRTAEDFCLLADAYRSSGQASSAIRNYQEALNIDPTSTTAHKGMALTYLIAGYPHIGEEVCRRALGTISRTAERRTLLNVLSQIRESEEQAKQSNNKVAAQF